MCISVRLKLLCGEKILLLCMLSVLSCDKMFYGVVNSITNKNTLINYVIDFYTTKLLYSSKSFW